MNVRKILFIHPSRGRPALAIRSAACAVGTMRSEIPYRYVFSLDTDDLVLVKYFMEVNALKFHPLFLVARNPSVIHAVNLAASQVRDNEDLIINIADDFGYSEGWDVKLLKFISTITRPDYLVHVTDMPNGKDLPIIQIMSTCLYRRLGYFFYPEYISMYADNDLLQCCRAMGTAIVYEGEPLGFDHLHPNYGKGQWDSTYERENRGEYYKQGRELFERRKSQNFGIQ